RSQWFRMREVGCIENFHSVSVHHKRVTKLHRDAARTIKRGCADGLRYSRLQRVLQIHNHQVIVGEYVSEIAGDGDPSRASEHSIGIESQRALQKIVGGISVEQR